MVRRFAVLLALVLACGCEPDPNALTWNVVFAMGVDQGEVAALEAWISTGTCATGDGFERYRAVFDRGATAPVPPRLAPGQHAFRVVARNADCEDIAAGCFSDALPRASGEVTTVLMRAALEPACVTAADCDGAGRCTVGDAGVEDVAPDVPGVDSTVVDSMVMDTAVDPCTLITETCNGADDNCDGVIDEGGVCEASTGCTTANMGGHAYIFCAPQRTWQEAGAHCTSFGYHLVVVESDAEEDFLEGILVGPDGGEWWIGLMDEDGDGNYENDEWVVGSTSYRRWGSGQPNLSDGAAFVDADDGGSWGDARTNFPRSLICEAP